MSEYHAHLGRRAELRQALINLKAAVDSHRESLRLALDPALEPGELDEGRILSLAALLSERIGQIREAQAKIEAINRIIGQ